MMVAASPIVVPDLFHLLTAALLVLLSTAFGQGIAVGLVVLGGVRLWQTFHHVTVSALGADERRFGALFGDDADRDEAADFRAWWLLDASADQKQGRNWMLGYGEWSADRQRRRRARKYGRAFSGERVDGSTYEDRLAGEFHDDEPSA